MNIIDLGGCSSGPLFQRIFGGPGYEEGHSAIVDNNGNFIVVGHTDSYGAGGDDVFVIKLDSAGNSNLVSNLWHSRR